MAVESSTRAPLVGTAVVLRARTSSVQRLAAHAFRRLGWGIVDQGMSSLTNYAVSFYVVRSLGAVDFGAFTLAYMAYGFILNGARGLCTDPLMVRFSGVSPESWRRAVAQSTGTSLTYGIITGLIVTSVGLIARGIVGEAFLGLGLTLPVLMLQDGWRYAFFSHSRGFHAFINDVIWAVTLVPGLILLRSHGHGDVFWFTFIWGATAGIGALAGLFQARLIPRPLQAGHWLRTQGDLGITYLISGILNNVGSQIRSYGVVGIVGLAVVGYVQASSNLMGPFSILYLGMSLVTIPEAARLLRDSPTKLTRFCWLVSAGECAAAVSWGILLLVAVPHGLGSVLLGHKVWPKAYPLIFPQVAWALAQAALTGAVLGINVLGAKRQLLWVSILGTAMGAAFTLVGAYIDGGAGMLTGLAIAAWILPLITWPLYRKALRQYKVTHTVGRRRSPGKHRRPHYAR
jgi:O-antigen/teichoic acid export membrane protein